MLDLLCFIRQPTLFLALVTMVDLIACACVCVKVVLDLNMEFGLG